jgi:hypothetical protein
MVDWTGSCLNCFLLLNEVASSVGFDVLLAGLCVAAGDAIFGAVDCVENEGYSDVNRRDARWYLHKLNMMCVF